jgi:UDP-4-amino-4,6-dideoxy-N-acetyl-beta-L-altrosamine transaminase
MGETLPYGRQWVDEDDIAAVAAALRSDFLTTGPLVGRFEAGLVEKTGAPCAAAVSSGTAALHAAYAVIGLGPGDEVVMPPMTFAATANAALYVGARPVFADVDPVTANLDAAAAAAAVTSRTRAIVAVDYSGRPADYEALRAVADRHGTRLLADAAHSLGARYRGRSVGVLADVTTLSFHPVKHITTGEGGAVLTADRGIDARVREFRSHGMVRDRERLGHDEGPWYHEMQTLGFNYRLTDVQCALGLSQLARLDAFLARRRAIAARYEAAFASVGGLLRPPFHPDVEPAWHLYVVRVADPTRRRPFFEALQHAGLGVQVHYIPVYLHPYYADLGYARGSCPNAEDFYSRAVSLPIFPAMRDADVDQVIETVTDVAARVIA